MDGIIIVNKPVGYTSRDVVNILNKKFKTKKIGHTGTLDPLASGVLVICINRALKVAEFIIQDDKEYIASIMLGIQTDTLDIEGNVLNTSKNIVDIEKIKEVLSKFRGEITQEVPLYSAIKVNGKKLYEYARNNEKVQLPKRKIKIYNLELISDIYIKDNHQCFDIKVKVSKGTYIRSLIRDIGNELDTYATMINLIRIKQGNISIDMTSSIDDILNDNYKLYKIEQILDYKVLNIEEKDLKKVKNGANIKCNFNDNRVLLCDNNNIVAIYEKDNVKKGEAKIVKMINNS